MCDGCDSDNDALPLSHYLSYVITAWRCGCGTYGTMPQLVYTTSVLLLTSCVYILS